MEKNVVYFCIIPTCVAENPLDSELKCFYYKKRLLTHRRAGSHFSVFLLRSDGGKNRFRLCRFPQQAPAFRRALACFRWLIAVSRFFLAALLSLRHDSLSVHRKLHDIPAVF